MTLQHTKAAEPPVDQIGIVDLLIRAVEGLFDGMMPGARLEALIDRLETPT